MQGRKMLLCLWWRAEFVLKGWQKQLFVRLDSSHVSVHLAAQKSTNDDATEQTMCEVGYRKLG